MFFRSEYQVKDLLLDLEEALEIRDKNVPNVVFRLKPESSNLYTVSLTLEVDDPNNISAMLAEIEKGVIPKNSTLTASPTDAQGLLKEGFGFYIGDLPEEIRVFVNKSKDLLDEVNQRMMNCLTWRLDLNSLSYVPKGKSLESSSDGINWNKRLTRYKMHIEFKEHKKLSGLERDDVSSFVSSGASQPLAYDVYREALSNLSKPRSALILGVMSVEIAVKTAIAKLAPDTTWLLENTSSPDVIKLLWKFFSQLPATTESKSPVLPSKRIKKQLLMAIETRNKLVHGGQLDKEHKALLMPMNLKQFLVDVADTNRLLEANTGNPWAAYLLSKECFNELKNEIVKQPNSQ